MGHQREDQQRRDAHRRDQRAGDPRRASWARGRGQGRVMSTAARMRERRATAWTADLAMAGSLGGARHRGGFVARRAPHGRSERVTGIEPA